MSNCTSCGMPCSGTSCSMCYGDPYHGNDGYYLEYLEQMEREEAVRREIEQQDIEQQEIDAQYQQENK